MVTRRPTSLCTIWRLHNYLHHPHFFHVVKNIVIIDTSPISTFVVVVVVVVATSVTVVQLGRVIFWRQRASASVEGTEVESHSAFF